MNVNDLRNLLREIREELQKRGLKNAPVLFDRGSSRNYAINTVGRNKEGLCWLGQTQADREDYDLDMVEKKLSTFNGDEPVFFKTLLGKSWYNLSKDWDIEGTGTVVIQVFEGNGFIGNAMTVGQLADILSRHDSRETAICASDGKKINSVYVDGYCFKDSELVLHSEIYQVGGVSIPSTAHLLHDIAWYDKDATVCYMYCLKTPGLCDFYDITGYHLDQDGDLILDVSKRYYVHPFTT